MNAPGGDLQDWTKMEIGDLCGQDKHIKGWTDLFKKSMVRSDMWGGVRTPTASSEPGWSAVGADEWQAWD